MTASKTANQQCWHSISLRGKKRKQKVCREIRYANLEIIQLEIYIFHLLVLIKGGRKIIYLTLFLNWLSIKVVTNPKKHTNRFLENKTSLNFYICKQYYFQLFLQKNNFPHLKQKFFLQNSAVQQNFQHQGTYCLSADVLQKKNKNKVNRKFPIIFDLFNGRWSEGLS